MKIGLVCPYNINRHGGVLEVILSLQKGLIKNGHSVKIITPKPRGFKGNNIDPNVIFLGSSTDFPSPAATTTQISSSEDIKKVDEILNREHFDILHFHEPWSPLLSRQLLQRSTCVNIATFHSKVPEAFMTRTVLKVVTPYLKSIINYLDELSAVSVSGAEYASQLTGRQITIIPNGIDLDVYNYNRSASQAYPKKSKTILFIGRLEGRKGVKYLLQAFKLYSEDHLNDQLIIVGDGPDKEKLELMSEDLELNNVSFLGFVSEQKKIELLKSADLFVSPALFGESFGIVLLEAMAMNLVTIAGNNSGYIDLLQGIGGLSIVDPKDSLEFARRIKLLLHEDKLREVWQNWAKEYVKQFDYNNVVKLYENFYQEALRKHRLKDKQLMQTKALANILESDRLI
jgi:phosphatidylinositol alpha-mannosyltransferase